MIILLIFIAALSKAIIDILDQHYNMSLFSLFKKGTGLYYWFNNNNVSYLNKYKNRNPIELEPRYFGATTFLIWIVDAFHFFNLTYRLSFLGMIWYYAENGFVFFWWLDLPFILCLHAVFFHGLYHKLLTKKFWRI